MEDKSFFATVLLLGIFLIVISFPSTELKGEEGKIGFNYKVINKSKGCLSSKIKLGTFSSFNNNLQKARTTVKLSNPCYKLKSFNIARKGKKAIVYIELEPSSGPCAQCIGYYQVEYKIRTQEALELEPKLIIPKVQKPKVKNKTKVLEKNETNKTEEPKAEFCGTETNGRCVKDADCEIRGCYQEVCQSKYETAVFSECGPYKPCYNHTSYGLECKCIQGACKWS